MVVKEIGGRCIDAGRPTGTPATSSSTSTNPANPQYIGDTDFDGPDPLTGMDAAGGQRPPGRVLATTTSSSSRPTRTSRPTGRRSSRSRPARTPASYAGRSSRRRRAVGVAARRLLNGPTVYGGYGCDASTPIPARATAGLPPLEPGEEAIVVLQRGPVGERSRRPRRRLLPRREGRERRSTPATTRVLSVNHHARRGRRRASAAPATSRAAPSPIVTRVHAPRGVPPHLRRPGRPRPCPYDPATEPPLGDLGEKVSADVACSTAGATRTCTTDRPAPTSTMDASTATRSPEALEPALRVRLRRPVGPRVRDRPDREPRVQLVLRGRHARVHVRRRRAAEQVASSSTTGGNNFWGVEQFTTPQGSACSRAPTATSGCTCSATRARARPAAGAAGHDDDGAVQGLGERAAAVLGRQREPADASRSSTARPAGSGERRPDLGDGDLPAPGDRVGAVDAFRFRPTTAR